MKKILIIRFSSIGDIVLTTPVVRCIKQQLPHVQIHYLTKPQYASLLQHNPYIDKVHVLEHSLLHTTKLLKAEQYDCIIDLHNNLRTRILSNLLNIQTYAFNKLNIEKWVMVMFKHSILPKEHIVDRYLKTAEPLGVQNDNLGLDYFLPPSFDVNFAQLPTSFIAIAIGAQHATKKLPEHKLIELCRQISLPVLLLGGVEDKLSGERIVSAAGSHVVSYCGLLSLHQSAYVVSKASKVITHDTGLMHIAAAFQKEIISIWGNTIPEFGMTPYYGKFRISNFKLEIRNLPCRPCSKIGFTACPKKHFNCMELQDSSAIAKLASVSE